MEMAVFTGLYFGQSLLITKPPSSLLTRHLGDFQFIQFFHLLPYSIPTLCNEACLGGGGRLGGVRGLGGPLTFSLTTRLSGLLGKAFCLSRVA